MVEVHLAEHLRRYTGDEATVHVDATTVADAFAALFARYPDLESRVLSDAGHLHRHLILFHNGTEVARDALPVHVVTAGDTLELHGAMAGG